MLDNKRIKFSRRALLRLGVLLFMIGLVCTPAAAWGDEGHHVIAMIAAQHLSQAAETEINAILGNNLQGLCNFHPVTVSDKLVCIALWPDDSRFTTHPETYNWHFVDIPLANNTYSPHDCDPQPGEEEKGMCGFVGLEHSLKILRKEITDPKITRAQALMFVVHIVGDLHQPLHTVLDGLGGNFHPAKYFNIWSQMHKVWDTKIIGTRMMKLGKDEKKYAEWLNAQMNASGFGSFTQADPVVWVNNAHGKAIEDAYKLKFIDGKASGKPSLQINYYNHNVDVVEQQLKLAGARLARILNEALG